MTASATKTVLKDVSLEMKHDFLARALADKSSRNKRRPSLTAFDGAVLAVVTTHVNKARGYSFIGVRAISVKLDASPAGVAKSISKLKTLEILVEAEGGKRNRAARLTPNWPRFLDLDDYGMAEDDAVHCKHEDDTVHGKNGDVPSTDLAEDQTVRKRKRKGANGTGRASLTRSATTPKRRGGSDRSARPSRTTPVLTADELLRRRRSRRSEGADK